MFSVVKHSVRDIFHGKLCACTYKDVTVQITGVGGEGRWPFLEEYYFPSPIREILLGWLQAIEMVQQHF